MECLNIDFIGPFPDQGYILVIVDTFTRWVELYHTTDATALSAAECLLKSFGRFGAPHQLRSDNGCTVSRITEHKKALEIRATKRSSVNIVGKMPFCVLEVENLF